MVVSLLNEPSARVNQRPFRPLRRQKGTQQINGHLQRLIKLRIIETTILIKLYVRIVGVLDSNGFLVLNFEKDKCVAYTTPGELWELLRAMSECRGKSLLRRRLRDYL
jgi:hypothetical protein